MNIQTAKEALDKVIDKSRVHLYKPIQIAEILYRDRIIQDITLTELETYRNPSKKWRDKICVPFLGRTSTSSARYQDDLFNENAVPPATLAVLGKENKSKNGIVEAYIYKRFAERFSQMSVALDYCTKHSPQTFQLNDFLDLFWKEAGLKRSIDKIYEIVVYALFSALVEVLELTVEVSYNLAKVSILQEFGDFSSNVLNLSSNTPHFQSTAKIYRVGVTNAADRGMDMWANFGLAIQIKHLSLSEEVAENIVNTITADRIVIVCKEVEQKTILSFLNQLGWKSRIQSIVTEKDLVNWYEKALRGVYAEQIGSKVLEILQNEIQVEFPATKNVEFDSFFEGREYHRLHDSFWTV
ncbi:MAG: HaeII family restriction endonuclease [Bacteroidetes bacterium]|nr:MAG: HaeII family restriction endonuclease [Bacteroidota bacterium]